MIPLIPLIVLVGLALAGLGATCYLAHRLDRAEDQAKHLAAAVEAERERSDKIQTAEIEYWKLQHREFYEELLRISDPQHRLVWSKLEREHRDIMDDRSRAIANGSRGMFVTLKFSDIMTAETDFAQMDSIVCEVFDKWQLDEDLERYIAARDGAPAIKNRESDG